MQRALAIETSGRIGSVALAENSAVVAERAFPHGLQHAAGIICMMDDLCRQHNWRAQELGEIYVSHGPGSFTGLRIGITAAKTLAFATGAKIVAVPTVRVLAANAPHDARNLIIVLDAKRGQIFTARFARENHDWHEAEPAHLDRLADMLRRSPRPVHLLGEGLPHHLQDLPQDEGVIMTDSENWRARAGAVADVGARLAAKNEFVDPDCLTPLYIRRPEAEEKWEALHAPESEKNHSTA